MAFAQLRAMHALANVAFITEADDHVEVLRAR